MPDPAAKAVEDAPAGPSRHGSRVREFVVVFAALLLLGATWIGVRHEVRSEAATRAAAKASSLALTVSERLRADLLAIDQVLRLIGEAALKSSSAPDVSVWRDLVVPITGTSVHLNVFDEQGVLRASSGPGPAFIDTGNPKSPALAGEPAGERLFLIEQGLPANIPGQWRLSVGRQVVRDDGSIAGLIVAAYEPGILGTISAFSGLLAVIDCQNGNIRALATSNGAGTGASIAGTPLHRAMRAQGDNGQWTGVSPFGGVERIHAFQPVHVAGLGVLAAVDGSAEADERVMWRSGAFGFGLGVTVLVVVLACVLLWVERAGRRREVALNRDRAELAAKTHQLEATLAGMTDGILLVDAGLRVLQWNDRFPGYVGVPAEMMRVGLPMEDILRAQTVAGEFGPVDVDAEVERRMALLRSGHSIGTIVRTRPNGNVLELRRNPLPDGGFVTLYTDVTARRRAEDRMQEAQKMAAIGRLTAGVAHDFNNLLASIMGSAELIERHLKDDPTQARRLGIILNSAQRGANLVRQLLAFSRKQPLELIAVDLNAIVRGMSDLLRSTLGGAVRVDTQLAHALWPALVDPVQIEHVILNLAINSRDAMPGGGTLTISTANVTLHAGEAVDMHPGEYVTVAVADTGTGMSEEVRRNAFDPFFTTKPVGKGSGLGLSQVYGVASQSGGSVAISTKEGEGTSVTVYLPRAPTEVPSSASATGGARAASVARGDGTVLLVEDEADVRETIASMLRDADFTPIVAGGGAAALAIIDGGRPFDALLVDVVMPGMNGVELASAVRAKHPGVPVVFLTGYRDDTRLEGERWVLSKPFLASALTDILRRAMQS